jgi:hypothetical protein
VENEQGDLINRIQIIYDRDWIEWRELLKLEKLVGI